MGHSSMLESVARRAKLKLMSASTYDEATKKIDNVDVSSTLKTC
jgi:hypothetical protein